MSAITGDTCSLHRGLGYAERQRHRERWGASRDDRQGHGCRILDRPTLTPAAGPCNSLGFDLLMDGITDAPLRTAATS